MASVQDRTAELSGSINSGGGDAPMATHYAKPGDAGYKSFQDAHYRTQQNRMRNAGILDLMDEVFERLGAAPLHGEISPSQFLGWMLMKLNKKSNVKLASVGETIFLTDNPSRPTTDITPDEAVALQHWLTLSKEDMRRLRFFLKTHEIPFPTTNSLLEVRKTLYLGEVKACCNNKGVCIDYQDTVENTISSLLEMLIDSGEVRFKVENFAVSLENAEGLKLNNLKLFGKDGADGAGAQDIWYHSKQMDEESAQHLFQYGFVPIKLVAEADGEPIVLWRNKKPNSPFTLRPIYLIREKESDKDLLNEVITTTDAARIKLNNQGLVVRCKIDEQDLAVDCGVDIVDSMKDVKLKTMVSGAGGADCQLCDTQQDEWLDKAKIETGFPINRSAQENTQIYVALYSEEEDGVERKDGDFSIRKGITQKPITLSDQRAITICHLYINGPNWWLKFFSKVAAGVKRWRLKDKASSAAIHQEAQKERMKTAIKSQTGITLDRLNKGGNTGSTTTGNAGRHFFTNEITQILEDLLVEAGVPEHVEAVKYIHIRMSVLVRIIASNRNVDLAKYNKLVVELHTKLAEYFPWARLNFTLHAALHHSEQLIRDHGGQGLGELSEEALESNNKDLREWMEKMSRKTSCLDQLIDTMHRGLERSNPRIHSLFLSFKPDCICCLCGDPGHTIRSCSWRSVSPSLANPHDLMFFDIIN